MVRMPNRKDQNSYDADYTAVKDLRDLAAEYGVAIVLVHHLRKAEADDPFDTISGTLGLTVAPDTIMIIFREGNGVLIEARGRDVEDIKKAVELVPAHGASSAMPIRSGNRLSGPLSSRQWTRLANR